MNILAIGAHPDDIELGCGGLLLKAARQGHNIFMYVLTRGSASGDPVQRCEELIRSAKFLGARTLWIDNFEDTKLSVNNKLINHIEYFINKADPDIILTHSAADYHHDHRSVGEGTLEAARQNQNILAYEIPLTKNFNPQAFYDITEVISDKIQLSKIFLSQKHKRFLKSGGISGLAGYRALQSRLNSNIEFVESFEVMKLCFGKDFRLLKLPIERPPDAVSMGVDTKEIIEYVGTIIQRSPSDGEAKGLQVNTPVKTGTKIVDALLKLYEYDKSRNLGSEWDAESIVPDLESDYYIEGNARKINGISSLDEARENDLAFCTWEGEKAVSLISESRAGIILCKKSLNGRVHPRSGSQLVFLDNPRFAFVRFANRVQEGKKIARIAPTAVIAETAKIGSNCHIGDFVVVGENCVIGDNTVIYDRATLVQNCITGEGCVIQSGVTMGSDGFAFERHQTGKLEKFPHFKGVRIGNNVEICTNCSIARGSLSDTVVGDGTKIDAMVHIAHNVRIGKDCQLTAGTIIGGSTTVGNSCWTGLNSTLKNKINVGNNVIVGAGACVINDVPDGDVVAGVPARSIKNKVSTDEIFLMSGQTLVRKGQEVNTC